MHLCEEKLLYAHKFLRNVNFVDKHNLGFIFEDYLLSQPVLQMYYDCFQIVILITITITNYNKIQIPKNCKYTAYTFVHYMYIRVWGGLAHATYSLITSSMHATLHAVSICFNDLCLYWLHGVFDKTFI